ncbi:MAG: FecR domain-containing protein [Planctomycetes bacterium]|nr:FecR domain-containing protein [Planctomycetota bacterium]
MKKARITTVRMHLIIAIFGACFLFAVGTQGKGDGKGVVTSIRDGKLEKMENANWKELAVGQDVFHGDRVRTDKTAVAIVKFPDVGQFVIGPSSEIEMGKDTKDFQTKMDRGALWLKADLPKGGRASVSTSLATAGVRGTAFSVIFSEDGGCVCTCSGKVEVAMKGGQPIDVSKGKYIPIISDEPAPKKAQSSTPLLGGKDTSANVDFNRCFNRKKKDAAPHGLAEEKKDTGFEFCFNCHIEGGKGKLKQDWK